MRRLLSSVENFIQCRDFYPVRIILFSAENSIQWVDLYQSCQNNSKKSDTEKKKINIRLLVIYCLQIVHLIQRSYTQEKVSLIVTEAKKQIWLLTMKKGNATAN